MLRTIYTFSVTDVIICYIGQAQFGPPELEGFWGKKRPQNPAAGDIEVIAEKAAGMSWA
jgi:hypothetical protein